MSDSSKSIESNDLHSNEITDEPLDPRIQIELERANAATSQINNLETQLDDARKLFQLIFTNCKQRLANLAKKLGSCVERARPYYNACKQTEEAQLETQKAAQEYQNSVEFFHTTKENLILAEHKLSKSDNITWQEYVTHATMKVTQAEQDKIHNERIHEEKSKLYQEYEQQRVSLSRSLTRTIIKSKPYFDAKLKAENELKNQKIRIEDVQKAIIQAKQTYRTALNNLEQISEEIHMKRKLPTREPGVGSDKPDAFIEFPSLELTEFPKIDLSDDSSDNDRSHSTSCLSVNEMSCMSRKLNSTNCMHQTSDTTLSLTNNQFSIQTSTSVNNEYDQRRKKPHGKMKSVRVIKTNETPLLSHLFGTHKCHSNPNLNLITEQ